MNVQYNLEDFPSDKANCGTCTRKGGHCLRSEKRFPNGLVRNSLTGNFDGVIYRCVNYTGKFIGNESNRSKDY